jgi:hypothetical protein
MWTLERVGIFYKKVCDSEDEQEPDFRCHNAGDKFLEMAPGENDEDRLLVSL